MDFKKILTAIDSLEGKQQLLEGSREDHEYYFGKDKKSDTAKERETATGHIARKTDRGTQYTKKDLPGQDTSKDADTKAAEKKAKKRASEDIAELLTTLNNISENKKVDEDEVDENAFNQAAAAAARANQKEFEFPKGSGKMHPVKMDKDTAHKLNEQNKTVKQSIDLEECYGQAMMGGQSEQESGMNINASTDTRTGSKSLTVTAQGEAAEQLAQLLRLSGLGSEHAAGHQAEMEETYANEPDPEVQGVEVQLAQGTDMHRPKNSYPKVSGGDNPMNMREAQELAALEKQLTEALAEFKISRDVAEGGVKQLPTQGADYSKYDTDTLKMMLRPGILHRDEAGFKALIRKELQKREQQSQQGVAEGGLNPKEKAEAQMIKKYGDGVITFSKTSNGGYFIQHENDFGDTKMHPYDPKTGKVDSRGSIRSTYHGEGVAEAAPQSLQRVGQATGEIIGLGLGAALGAIPGLAIGGGVAGPAGAIIGAAATGMAGAETGQAYGAKYGQKAMNVGYDAVVNLWRRASAKLGGPEGTKEFVMAHVDAVERGMPTFYFGSKKYQTTMNRSQASQAIRDIQKIATESMAEAKKGSKPDFLDMDGDRKEPMKKALADKSKKKVSETVVAEKAKSQQQQKFMGMVHAMQKGERIKGASPELKKVARSMSQKDVRDYAATKHQGLPKKIDRD